MHWHTERLIRINQISFNDDYVLCAYCKEYLGPPIWSIKGKKNICGSCKDTNLHFASSRNYILEDVLCELKYPCTSPAECQFIGTYKQAQEHSVVCQPSILCTYCLGAVDVRNAVNHFLVQHCNRRLSTPIDGVFGPIVLWMPLKKDRVFMFQAGDVYYILFLRIWNKNQCAISVVKHIDTPCLKFSRYAPDDYLLQWTSSRTMETNQFKGKTCTIADFFTRTTKSFLITMNHKDRLELRIVINNYTVAKKMFSEECPICFDEVENMTQTHQCVNGHTVCQNCHRKINTCPFCREPMNIAVNAQDNIRCENTHCLQVIDYKGIRQHLNYGCAYKPTGCPECKVVMPRLKILQHLETEHRKLLNTCEFFIQSRVTKTRHYILFKGVLFCLTISVEGKTNKGGYLIGFQVQQMFKSDEESTDSFQYEIHFYQRPSSVLASLKVGNVCQSEDNDEIQLKLQSNQIPYYGKDLGFFCLHLFSINVENVSQQQGFNTNDFVITL